MTDSNAVSPNNVTQLTVAVVIPVYRALLAELTTYVERCRAEIESRGYQVEIMLVFDSGMAHSLAAVSFIERSQKARVMYLSTNVGQQAAVFKGLKSVKADMFLTMDEDGSHKPSEIPLLLRPLESGKADLVIGIGRSSEVGRMRRLGSLSMMWLGRIYLGPSAPRAWSSFRAMKSSVVSNLSNVWNPNGVLGFELFRCAESVELVAVTRVAASSASSYKALSLLGYFLRACRHYLWRNRRRVVPGRIVRRLWTK